MTQHEGYAVPDRLILGINPLHGTDHYLRERARDPARRPSIVSAARIIQIAARSGAQGFNFEAGPEGAQLLGQLKADGFEGPLGLYPMIPDGRFFSSLLNQGTVAAASAMVSDLSVRGKAKALFSGGWAYLTQNPYRAISTYIGIEIDRLRRAAPPRAELRTVLVHELLTDPMVALDARVAFSEYVQRLRQSFGVVPGFVTRNFVRFVDFCKRAGHDPRQFAIMTPVNALGFQMAPDRQSVEAALEHLGGRNVIAMSILGGGMIEFQRAVDYAQHVHGVEAFAVGLSTPEHARSTFRAFASRSEFG